MLQPRQTLARRRDHFRRLTVFLQQTGSSFMHAAGIYMTDRRTAVGRLLGRSQDTKKASAAHEETS